MSRSFQLDNSVLPARLFMGGHLTESQCRKLSTLKHKRMSEPRSVATIQHREHPPRDNSRSTRKHETMHSPYRTFQRSEKKLNTLHKPPPRTEDKSNNSSYRKIRAKSLSSNAKLNFRLRVYANPFARRFSKLEELKPQQMNSETVTVYEKLFRRRKYGLEPQLSNKVVVPPVPHRSPKASHATAALRPLDSEEDQISRNYIKNQIFMFQNESLEFGYDQEPSKKEASSAKMPTEQLSRTLHEQSSSHKKNFRKGKYERAPVPVDLQTIEQISRQPSMHGKESVLDEAIIIRQGDPTDTPLKRTIESRRSEVHA